MTMLVEQIWTGNKFRNYNYLIACSQTGEAIAVDPLAHAQVFARAKDKGWEITQIVNTHEHGDHTGGNDPLVAATGAKILAHHRAGSKIAHIDRGLVAGDIVRAGKTVELEVLDTPGHTMSHVCLLGRADSPALFSGDTLFNAGAGNCHNGGSPDELYLTFTSQLALLPGTTRVFPGHDYIEKNLEFTLDREPKNVAAVEFANTLGAHDPAKGFVTTIELERRINVFFRLENPDVIERLRERFPDLPARPERKTVFLKLRELRNAW
jgi:hydroxyacylglutathione hydrolase